MQILIRELRELVRGPEFLATLLICLLLGAGEPVQVWFGDGPGWIEDRLSRILTVSPFPDALEELHRLLPPFR